MLYCLLESVEAYDDRSRSCLALTPIGALVDEQQRRAKTAAVASHLSLSGAFLQSFSIGDTDSCLCPYQTRGWTPCDPIRSDKGGNRRLVLVGRHVVSLWLSGVCVNNRS